MINANQGAISPNTGIFISPAELVQVKTAAPAK